MGVCFLWCLSCWHWPLVAAGGINGQVAMSALDSGRGCFLSLALRSTGVLWPAFLPVRRGRGFGTRPWFWLVCLWRRPLASHHCTF